MDNYEFANEICYEMILDLIMTYSNNQEKTN